MLLRLLLMIENVPIQVSFIKSHLNLGHTNSMSVRRQVISMNDLDIFPLNMQVSNEG